MDKGEFDDRKNLNSILESSYDNDLGGSVIESKNDSVLSANNESFEKSATSKRKGKK